eukprot:COSAG02_NODE_11257_length_1758_cov_56.182640_2_plen_57_part_00
MNFTATGVCNMMRPSGLGDAYSTEPSVLHMFRVRTFHWKISPQSVSRELLETDWGA